MSAPDAVDPTLHHPESRLTGVRRSTSQAFRLISGMVIAALLIYAPFAMGSTQPWAIATLNLGVTVATGCWIISRVLYRSDDSRRRSNLWLIVLLSVVGLCCGWFMVYNASHLFSYTTGYPMGIVQQYPRLPGAWEKRVAMQAMVRMDGLFGAFIVALDLAREPAWRRRWISTIVWTGASIALLGVAQRSGMVTFIASRMSDMEGTYFSTFNYHANAGAYMNLGLALAGPLCLYRFRGGRPTIEKIWSTLLLAAIMIGVLDNTSRGAQAVSALIVAIFSLVGIVRWRADRERTGRRRRHWLIPCTVLLILFLFVGLGMRSATNVRRWRNLPADIATNSSRWQMWHVTRPMVRTAGWMGHGPGSFKMLLPVSPDLTVALYSRWIVQQHIPGMTISMWSMAHNDYLQTMVEYGWLGAIIFGTIVFGGLLCAVLRVAGKLRLSDNLDGCLLLGASTAVFGTLLHATVDFPMQVASVQITLAVLVGICWSSCRWSPRT